MTQPPEPELPAFPSEVDDLVFDSDRATSPVGEAAPEEQPEVTPSRRPAGGRPVAHRSP
jgi:hypothetical protein